MKNHLLRRPFMAILNYSFEICPSLFVSKSLRICLYT